MKNLIAAIAAGVLYATSTLASAAGFPGLPDITSDPKLLGPEMTAEELLEQKEKRQKLEEFAKKLKAWWYAENYPKPIPYVSFDGAKIKLPKNFLAAYLKAHKNKQLDVTWNKVENSLKKATWLKKKKKS